MRILGLTASSGFDDAVAPFAENPFGTFASQDPPPSSGGGKSHYPRTTRLRSALGASRVVGPHFTIIGTGPIGDKAGKLIDKTPAIRNVGWAVPHRVVLAQSVLDDILAHNGFRGGIGGIENLEGLDEKIRAGRLSPQQLALLTRVSRKLGGVPLAVRSSAMGDARGSGTYQSVFTLPQKRAQAVLNVLASYFTPEARKIRTQAGATEGMGIIVEPLIGQDVSTRHAKNRFAPPLSGFGYTSTARGPGYLAITVGLGGGVESRNYHKMSRQEYHRFTKEGQRRLGGGWDSYIGNKRSWLIDRPKQWTRSELLSFDPNDTGHIRRGFIFNNKKSGSVDRMTLSFYANAEAEKEYRDDTLGDIFHHIDLDVIFDQMAALEEALGGPHYIEWAITLDTDGQPKFWITQIDDINLQTDFIDFNTKEDVLLTGFDPVGSGERLCQDIVWIEDPRDLDALRAYNETHSNYVVIYASSLITSFSLARGEGTRQIDFMDVSNAAGLIEVQKTIGWGDGSHSRGGNPISHWKGKLDWTKKFFAQLRYQDIRGALDHMRRVNNRKGDGLGRPLMILPWQVRVLSSPKQDQLAVMLLEDKDRVEEFLNANGATAEQRAEWDELDRKMGNHRGSEEAEPEWPDDFDDPDLEG